MQSRVCVLALLCLQSLSHAVSCLDQGFALSGCCCCTPACFKGFNMQANLLCAYLQQDSLPCPACHTAGLADCGSPLIKQCWPHVGLRFNIHTCDIPCPILPARSLCCAACVASWQRRWRRSRGEQPGCTCAPRRLPACLARRQCCWRLPRSVGTCSHLPPRLSSPRLRAAHT